MLIVGNMYVCFCYGVRADVDRVEGFSVKYSL